MDIVGEISNQNVRHAYNLIASGRCPQVSGGGSGCSGLRAGLRPGALTAPVRDTHGRPWRDRARPQSRPSPRDTQTSRPSTSSKTLDMRRFFRNVVLRGFSPAPGWYSESVFCTGRLTLYVDVQQRQGTQVMPVRLESAAAVARQERRRRELASSNPPSSNGDCTAELVVELMVVMTASHHRVGRSSRRPIRLSRASATYRPISRRSGTAWNLGSCRRSGDARWEVRQVSGAISETVGK